jgi:hypothetical protein
VLEYIETQRQIDGSTTIEGTARDFERKGSKVLWISKNPHVFCTAPKYKEERILLILADKSSEEEMRVIQIQDIRFDGSTEEILLERGKELAKKLLEMDLE